MEPSKGVYTRNPHLQIDSPTSIVLYQSSIRELLYTRRVCSSDTIEVAEENLRTVLVENGYPAPFVDKHSKPWTKNEGIPTVERKAIYVRLPFKGDNVNRLMNSRINNALQRAFPAARLQLLNTTNKIGSSNLKDQVPIGCKSKCVYQFECVCGDKYIGRTDRNLIQRMKEHLPAWLRNNGDG